MNLKNKKLINILLILFLVYFSFGMIMSYYFNVARYFDFVFSADCPRVLGDLTLLNYNHYRAVVHPLFIIIFNPIVTILKNFMNNDIIATVFIQSVLGIFCTYLVFKILNKILNNKTNSILLAILFAISSGQIIFTATVETYIFAQFFLLIMWYYFLSNKDKNYDFRNYVVTILLGVAALSITITNFMQFLIALFFFFTLNTKNKNAFLKSVAIVIGVLALSVFLATIQNLIWPSAPNFFVKNITDLINSSSEEKLYINKVLSKESFLNVFNTLFSNSMFLGDISVTEDGRLMFFSNSLITSLISVVMTLFILILNILYIFKRKSKIFEDKFYLAISFSLLFNIVLHLFYGNSCSFLYVCHFNFLLLFNIVYIFEKFNFIKKKYIILALIIIFCFDIFNMFKIVKILRNVFEPIGYVQKFPFLIFSFTLSLLLIINFKNNFTRILGVIILFFIGMLCWSFINNTCIFCKNNIFNIYNPVLLRYEN